MKTPKIINAISFVEDDLISASNDQKAKPFYIKPVFRRATAVAACLAIVAVTAFALTKKPDNNISSNNTSSNNNVSSNNSGETSSQNKKVIYVTGDTPDDYYTIVSCLKSLNAKYISPKLQEKMDLYKDYKDTEVVYSVIVEIFIAGEDGEEGENIAKASPEVEALYQQYLAAREEEDKAEADLRAFNNVNPGNEPEIVEKRKELIAICDKKREIREKASSARTDLRLKIIREYCSAKCKERLEFATQFSEKEPVVTSYNSSRYYMDLTGEEINKLAEKGGYIFRLSSNDIMSSDIVL